MSRDRGRSPYEDRDDNPQVYVGKIPRGIYERDLEDIFLTIFWEMKYFLLDRIICIFWLTFNTNNFNWMISALLIEILIIYSL